MRFKDLAPHRYISKMAWQVVSSVYKASWQWDLCHDFRSPDFQIVRKQITTDKKLIGLIVTMEHIYSFVDVIQANISEKVDVPAEIIKRIFSQVNIYRSRD
jgi:hypothetical protein